MDEQGVELHYYISLLSKRKKLIIGLTVITVLITGILSFFVLPPVYEASGSLLVNPERASVNITSPEQLLSPLTYLPQISVATYQEIIKSKDFEKKIFDELNLSSPPYNLTIDRFDKMLNVRNPSNTTLIVVSIKYKDPEISKKIVQSILSETVLYVSDLNTSQFQSSKTALEEQFSVAKKGLEIAQKALSDFNSQRENVDSLQREKNSYILALGSYLSDLLLLNSQIAERKERLNMTREELKKENRYIVTEKSIVDDPLLSQLAQQLVNENIIYLSQLKVSSQEINQNYQNLRSLEEGYSIDLSGLNAKKTALEQLVSAAKERINQLDNVINSKQLELYDLNRKVDIAQTYYSVVSSSYIQSSFAPLCSIAISGEPIVPEKPVAPRKLLNIAIAGIAALLFSCLLALVIEYFYDGKKKEIS